MRQSKQISVPLNTYFCLLQLKVDYKVTTWRELFNIIFKQLDINLETCIKEKIENGEVIKLH